MKLGIGLGASNRRSATVPQIISGSAPSLAELSAGETLGSRATWGAYLSLGGTIVTPTTRLMRLNDGDYITYVAATVVGAGETWRLMEVVTDTGGNSRAFFSGTVAVGGFASAPTLVTEDDNTITLVSLGTVGWTPVLTTEADNTITMAEA